ncbi:MAG: methionine ABC transporter ATP-binding protein [bacterium]|nr:methionine ABC transporter ATP-binding protein [bacterium]
MSEFAIEVKDLHKTFRDDKKSVEVLKGISFSVGKGEIFGIVGFSGAGKSTLVRCMNRLEEPDSGEVIINGKQIIGLKRQELNQERRKIGMIFQQFNLFDSMDVYHNIAFPLKPLHMSKAEMNIRIDEILELVGLTDKKFAYPGELSGGQKQRVGIARALANNPEILLCDEATSALDLQTTISILDLLMEINKKLDLTIILITHELEVIKYACDRVAVMENGEFREEGTIQEVFTNPQCTTARNFIQVFNRFRDGNKEDAK